MDQIIRYQIRRHMVAKLTLIMALVSTAQKTLMRLSYGLLIMAVVYHPAETGAGKGVEGCLGFYLIVYGVYSIVCIYININGTVRVKLGPKP